MYYTYVLYSKKFNKIYIGQTDNLESRINEHNSGLSNYSKKYKPWEIIYYEEFLTRIDALKREKELKSHKGRDYIRINLLKQNLDA